jgi:uncharacterized protein (TIGR00251 family)
MMIRVTPNARRDEVFSRNGVLCVKVSVRPQRGRANKRALEVLEKEFHCKAMLVAGQKSRDKEIEFAGGCAGIEEKIRELEKRS